MTRLPGPASGFTPRTTPVASRRLTQAVAASLVIGAAALGLIVALTMLSVRVTMAMSLPG